MEVSGGLAGESQSSFESDLASEDECEGEGVVSEVEASKEGSLRSGEKEGDLEVDLWIGE